MNRTPSQRSFFVGRGLLVAVSLALSFAACDSGLGGYVVTADCSAYTSCDTCTPVLGCGWCTAAGGSGVCVSDPDYCPTQEFSWTWDSKGCSVAADASVGVTDEASTFDVSVVDASTPPDVSTSDASSVDASVGEAAAQDSPSSTDSPAEGAGALP